MTPAPWSGPTSEQQPAGRAPRRGPRTVRVALLAALVLLATLTGITGAYAYWVDQQVVDGAQLRTGSAELTVHWTAESSAVPLLPGETSERTAELLNEGDVPLRITAATAEPTQGFTLQIRTGTCESSATTAAVGVDPVTLASAEHAGEALVLHPGDRASLCLALRASDDLRPEQTMAYHLILEGTQIQ